MLKHTSRTGRPRVVVRKRKGRSLSRSWPGSPRVLSIVSSEVTIGNSISDNGGILAFEDIVMPRELERKLDLGRVNFWDNWTPHGKRALKLTWNDVIKCVLMKGNRKRTWFTRTRNLVPFHKNAFDYIVSPQFNQSLFARNLSLDDSSLRITSISEILTRFLRDFLRREKRASFLNLRSFYLVRRARYTRVCAHVDIARPRARGWKSHAEIERTMRENEMSGKNESV